MELINEYLNKLSHIGTPEQSPNWRHCPVEIWHVTPEARASEGVAGGAPTTTTAATPAATSAQLLGWC
ncbi:hypothetical protein DPMN_052343 [Dreissena polymorpha]|uniref:Uncharacterized protein n=1 Tax=Dreissena polymorpha TaxID=45954 RepID=A0A9D4HPQ9_DREPO|nr:hypothetical protein DPMN_052343 [Dreissena polymorpha]